MVKIEAKSPETVAELIALLQSLESQGIPKDAELNWVDFAFRGDTIMVVWEPDTGVTLSD